MGQSMYPRELSAGERLLGACLWSILSHPRPHSSAPASRVRLCIHPPSVTVPPFLHRHHKLGLMHIRRRRLGVITSHVNSSLLTRITQDSAESKSWFGGRDGWSFGKRTGLTKDGRTSVLKSLVGMPLLRVQKLTSSPSPHCDWHHNSVGCCGGSLCGIQNPPEKDE